MTATVLDQSVLDALGKLDTPTVCNALEIVAPERRAIGFTVDPLVCAFPELPPMVGYARTATFRATVPPDVPADAMRERRLGYYSYVADGPSPSIAVIQDIDGERRGYGAFWGEVNSNLHKGLGALGVITDGSVRDLTDIADGFQMMADRVGPSHAHGHVVAYDLEVTVAGMTVNSGDLIHADRHGAVIVPHNVAAEVPAAAELIGRREALLLTASARPDFSIDDIAEAYSKAADIH
jgi:regulator of RNase E activity RraA